MRKMVPSCKSEQLRTSENPPVKMFTAQATASSRVLRQPTAARRTVRLSSRCKLMPSRVDGGCLFLSCGELTNSAKTRTQPQLTNRRMIPTRLPLDLNARIAGRSPANSSSKDCAMYARLHTVVERSCVVCSACKKVLKRPAFVSKGYQNECAWR